MKKVSLLIFALILLLVFVACQPTEEACTHEWTAATCTAAKTCTKCNATEGEAAGHDWAAATCTAPKTCKTCNETEGAPLGHTEVTLEAKAPTCTATGLTEGKKCSVCNTVTKAQTTVAKLPHAEVQHEAQAATCTEGGWDAYVTCENCEYTTFNAVAPHGHTEEVLAAVESTCTATGLTEGKKCTECGTVTVEQTVTDKKAHTEIDITPVLPTCTVAGSKDGKKCSVCGTTTVEPTVVPALGHDTEGAEAQKENKVDPTCTEVGGYDMVVRCWECGEVASSEHFVVEKIPHVANEHGYTYNNDATCEEDGTQTATCSMCNNEFTVTKENTALGHKMPENTPCGETWICENEGCGKTCGPREHEMLPATCTEPSSCANCDHTEGEPNGHTPGAPVEEDIVPAKCEVPGSYKLVTYCTVCGGVVSSEDKTIAALEHDMAPATCDDPSTCRNNCGKTEGEKLANHTIESTIADGKLTYSCTTCNDTFTTDEALIYTGEKNNDFMLSKNGDPSITIVDGAYYVAAGEQRSQYMLYGPSNSKGHANSLTKWGEGAFGVYEFDLKAGTITEELRVIIMSARDNANWDANGQWNGNSVDVLAVKPNGDGTFNIYGKSVTSNVFATVSGDEWVNVRMFIQMANNGLKISYYINGQFCNTYESEFPIAGQSIKNLDINCFYMCGWTAPGTGLYLDNIHFGAQQYSDWLFDEHKHAWQDATCEEARHCTACGLVDETAPAFGHTNTTRDVNVVAPDCVNPGSHDVETYCTTCGKVSGTEHVVDAATGHDLDENNVCKVCGTDLHTCNLVADEVIAPTCTEGGYTVYKCDHANCTMHENRDFTDPTGHSMQDATCTAPKTCSKCGHTEGSALGHNYSAPTCAVASKCTVCGDVKGNPNADAHTLTSTYANNTLTYSCSICNYKFVVDTFDYSDGTNYNGMHANASANNGVYTTNGSNYPVMKDGYLEFIRTEESAGAQKQLQLWLPSANGGTNKFSGFTAASNSIGYFAFKVDAKTDVNFEMKLVDHRVDAIDKDGDGDIENVEGNPDKIRWGDDWAINDPVFRVLPADNGVAKLVGFNSVVLASATVDENGFTGWVDVAIQIVLDPATDKVIAHYYINGAYVTTSSRELTTHTDAIQGVYLNFNSKAAGCGYRIDNLTFGYSAHKHDFEPTLTNGTLTYDCACGTKFLASSEVLEWNGDGSDNSYKNVPNGNVELTVNSQGQYEYIFKPYTETAPDFSASGTQSGDGWYEYDGKGFAGGQLQMWMPSNNRGESTLTGFSCENDAVGVISFNVKTNMQRHPDWDTSLTFSIGKPRNASDWNDGGSWNDDSINIFTIEEYQASGIVVKGGLNGTNLNLGTIPVTEDGWSEWFNVMIVIEMTKEEYINVYYYINGALCGTDSRDLNNPGNYRTLNPKMIEALQISGWTYVPNTGIVFDDFYFGYTANGHNTLDGHVHNLTETTCGEKSTCSCGWTGYTVAHTIATACAPKCSVCGLTNENAKSHENVVTTIENGVAKRLCTDCNYYYLIDNSVVFDGTAGNDFYYSKNGKMPLVNNNGVYEAIFNTEQAMPDISEVPVKDGKPVAGSTIGDWGWNNGFGAQHMYWIPTSTAGQGLSGFSCANNSVGVLSFKMQTNVTAAFNISLAKARNDSDWSGWGTSELKVLNVGGYSESGIVLKGGLNSLNTTLATIPVADGWSEWFQVDIAISLKSDKTITLDYFINGEYITTVSGNMTIDSYDVRAVYINGWTYALNTGIKLDDIVFGCATSNEMHENVPPFYKEVIEGGKDAVTDAALKTIVDAKLKQCDQSNPGSDPSVDLFAEGGTSVFVIAEGKEGQDVECLYVSRKVAWTGKETKQLFTEFRFAINGEKEGPAVTSISFDYKIDGTVETNDKFTFTDLDGTKFSADAYVQIKTNGSHPGAGDAYPELQGTDLVLDGEWHTMTIVFDEPIVLLDFLLNLYHFQGEILIANIDVQFVEG